MRMKSWLTALVVGCIASVGCGEGFGAGGDRRGEEGGPSALSLAVSGPNFKGNSVKIKGKRDLPADKKYPCESEVEKRCYKFDKDGHPLDEHGNPVVFKDLCPSTNYPQATWTFDYTIYGDDKCTPGEEITTGDGDDDLFNFVCHDINDIVSQQYPNQSVEYLVPGKNHNNVICRTKNAKKTWDFDVCVEEYKPGYDVALDCGCHEEKDACVCPQGFAISDLPETCSVEPRHGCRVVCGEFQAELVKTWTGVGPSVTLTNPPTAGNLLVAVVTQRQGTTTASMAGWDFRGTAASANEAHSRLQIAVFTKTATGAAESASAVWGNGSTGGNIVVAEFATNQVPTSFTFEGTDGDDTATAALALSGAAGPAGGPALFLAGLGLRENAGDGPPFAPQPADVNWSSPVVLADGIAAPPDHSNTGTYLGYAMVDGEGPHGANTSWSGNYHSTGFVLVVR